MAQLFFKIDLCHVCAFFFTTVQLFSKRLDLTYIEFEVFIPDVNPFYTMIYKVKSRLYRIIKRMLSKSQ